MAPAAKTLHHAYIGGLLDHVVSLMTSCDLVCRNYPQINRDLLLTGAFLHDIGKISIPDSILFKKGPLDQDEWRIMRTHTIKGEEICRPMKCLSPVLPIVRSHHERWNGSGLET